MSATSIVGASGGLGRRRGRLPARTPAAAFLLAPVAVTLGLAACSAAGPAGPAVASAGTQTSASSVATAPPGSSSQSVAQAGRAAAACLRAHGIPAQDPILPLTSRTPQAAFGVNPATLPAGAVEAAARACDSQVTMFLRLAAPPPVWGTTDAQKRQFAVCMRAHGVPNWPDPFPGSNDFPLRPNGINPQSPRLLATELTCSVLPH